MSAQTQQQIRKPINLRRTGVTGAIFVFVAIFWRLAAVPIMQRVTGSAVAEGQVVDAPSQSSTSSPVVTFTSPTGQTLTFQSNFSAGSFPEYHVGDSVTILYKPDDPQHANVISFRIVNIICGIFLFVGASYLLPLIPAYRRRQEERGAVFE